MTTIGHRGASGYKPENTLASFKKALELGVDMIEFDVHLLESGELAVIHDETVDRTTDGTGQVAKFTFSQIRQLNAGKGQKVPLLTEVLDLVAEQVPVNIELKGTGTARPVADMIRRYTGDKGWDASLFMVSSFNLRELRAFIKLMPHIHTGALYEAEPTRFLDFAKQKSTFSANLNAVFITDQDVQKAHQRGLKVYVYTVNDANEALRLQAMDVDGVFSDYPDKIAARIGQVERNRAHAGQPAQQPVAATRKNAGKQLARV